MPSLQTSVPDIYAIGECASWENQTFGIIAPGIEMADVLAFNLTNPDKEPKSFKRPDLSTKLKLLGVDVASFGDFFADRDGPKFLPGQRPFIASGPQKDDDPPVKALTYKDPFGGVYKKYLFTMDGKYLLGGMMIGDTKDYLKLNQMAKTQKMLEVPPSQFILGSQKDGDENADELWVLFPFYLFWPTTKYKQRRRYPDLFMSQCHQRRPCFECQEWHMQVHWRGQIMHQGRNWLWRLYAFGPVDF